MSGIHNSSRKNANTNSNIYLGLVFRREITLASDFPDLTVTTREYFHCVANVTDNNPLKTNTGQSFINGDFIKWSGKDWEIIGNDVSTGSGSPGATGATGATGISGTSITGPTGTTGYTGPNVYVDIDPPPTAETGQLWFDTDDDGGAPSGGGGLTQQQIEGMMI